MGLSLSVIKELTIRARAEGIEQVVAGLGHVAASQVKVSQTADGMAVATETASRRQLSAAGALRTLENRIDGVTRANRAAEASEKTLQRAIDQGVVSRERAAVLANKIEADRIVAVAQAEARERTRMQAVSHPLMPAANDEKNRPNRFGLRGYQTSNLAYQGGDVVAQLSSGTGFGQIAMQQGPQVAQILAEAEGGVKGVAAGLLSLATPLNLAVAGFGALAASAVYFAYQTREKIVPLNDAMERHRDIVKEVADSYGLALDASQRLGIGSQAAFALRRSEQELRLSSRQSLFDSFVDTTKFVRTGRDDQGQQTSRVTADYAAFTDPLLKLRQGIKASAPDAAAFVDEVAKIANLDPANKKLGDMAKELIGLADPAAQAKRQLDAMTDAAKHLSDTNLASAFASLRSFVPDPTTDRDKINAAADQAELLARSYGEVMEIERQRSAALGEIARKEGEVSAARAVDLRSIEVSPATMDRLRASLNGEAS